MLQAIYKPAVNAALIIAIIGVMLGAMGAHALRPTLVELNMGNAFETGVRYQFYHSFALLFAGVLHTVFPNKWIRRATWFFLTGILCFSGSIYLMILLKSNGGSLGKFALITPLGGMFLITGWLFLLFGINQKRALNK